MIVLFSPHYIYFIVNAIANQKFSRGSFTLSVIGNWADFLTLFYVGKNNPGYVLYTFDFPILG
jgi:hypothetical protein